MTSGKRTKKFVRVGGKRMVYVESGGRERVTLPISVLDSDHIEGSAASIFSPPPPGRREREKRPLVAIEPDRIAF